MPNTSKESQFVNEQTIAANRLQSYRDPAQQELADWIRFSSQDAEKYRDGLTTASMEIEGFSGWVVRNSYGKDDVMKNDFREKGIDQIKQEVSASAGWILIASKDNSVVTLLETGRRMQRLFWLFWVLYDNSIIKHVYLVVDDGLSSGCPAQFASHHR